MNTDHYAQHSQQNIMIPLPIDGLVPSAQRPEAHALSAQHLEAHGLSAQKPEPHTPNAQNPEAHDLSAESIEARDLDALQLDAIQQEARKFDGQGLDDLALSEDGLSLMESDWNISEKHMEQLRLVHDAQNGNDKALEELCTRYNPLLKRYSCYMTDDDFFNDLYCFLSLVFIDSIYMYDVTHNVPVPAYFKIRIRQAAHNYIRCFKRQKELETHRISTTSTYENEDASNNFEVEITSPLDTAIQAEIMELVHLVRAVIHKLSPFAQYIIYEHYQNCRSLTDIAHRLRLTKQDISYHHSRILTKISNIILDDESKLKGPFH